MIYRNSAKKDCRNITGEDSMLLGWQKRVVLTLGVQQNLARMS